MARVKRAAVNARPPSSLCAASSKPTVAVTGGSAERFGHVRHDQARIDAAREERAERHFALQAVARLPPTAAHRLRPAGRSTGADVGVEVLDVPVVADRCRGSRRSASDVGRLQLAHVPIRGRAARRNSQATGSLRSASRSRSPFHAGLALIALISDAKCEHAVERGMEQRLLAEPVARQQDAPRACRSSMANANMPSSRSTQCVAVLLVGVDDRFGVGVGAEAVAALPRGRGAARGGCRSRR